MSSGLYVDPCNCACYYECGGGFTEYHRACSNTNTLYNTLTSRCDNAFEVNCGMAPWCDLNGQNCQRHNDTVTTPKPVEHCSDETAAKCTYYGEYVDDEEPCDEMRCFCENIPPTPAVPAPCAPGTVWCELAGSTDVWGCIPIEGCNSDCYP